MLGLSHFGFLFSNMITIIHTLTTLFRNETCKGKWSFFNKPEKDAGQSNYFYGTTYFAAARSAVALRIFKLTKFSLLLTKLES